MITLRRSGPLHSLTRTTAHVARSVAMQVTVSACTAAVIGMIGASWLNRDTGAPTPAPVIVLAPNALPPQAQQASLAQAGLPAGGLAWGGVDTRAAKTPGAFPMEEEARFGLSLSRPYKVTAANTWSPAREPSPASEEGAQTAGFAETSLRKRRSGVETAEVAAEIPAVLPPSRPLDLTTYAVTTPAPDAPSTMDSPLYFLTPEKMLPDPAKLASRVVDRADAAGAALLKSVTWAAGSVTSALTGH